MKEVSPAILYMARKKVLENVQSLYEDAKLLFENNRWPRSFFLSQIAIEELGKYGIIVTSSVWAVHGSLDWNHFRKRFTNHKDKTNHFLLFEHLYLETQSDAFLEESNKIRDANKREADLQEKVKMASLYCDMNKEGMISLPKNIINKELCEISLNLLQNRLALVSNYEKEIACKINIENLNKDELDKLLEKIGFQRK